MTIGVPLHHLLITTRIACPCYAADHTCCGRAGMRVGIGDAACAQGRDTCVGSIVGCGAWLRTIRDRVRRCSGRAGIGGNEVGIALEDLPPGDVVIGVGYDILAHWSGRTGLNQASLAIVEGAGGYGGVAVEPIDFIDLFAGSLRGGAAAPVGVGPLFGLLPAGFPW